MAEDRVTAEVTEEISHSNDDMWQEDRSMLSCNKYMFENSLATDVTFLVCDKSVLGKLDSIEESEDRKIKAHKYVLMARSPVFWNMFNGQFEEKANCPIVVEDADPEAFYQMILYMYTDEVDIKPDLVMFLLHVSKKYMFTSLTKKCVTFLQDSLNVANACIFLDHCRFFQEEDLTLSCLRLITSDTKAALESPTFLDIRLETLACILDLEVMSVPEIDVFQSVIAWTKHACSDRGMEVTGENMRVILGDVLQKVHFPVMSLDEFAEIAVPTDILPSEHENKLFRHICGANKVIQVFGPERNADPYPYSRRYYYQSDHQVSYKVYAELTEAKNDSAKTFINCYTFQTETNIVLKEIEISKCLGSAFNWVCLWMDGQSIYKKEPPKYAYDQSKEILSLNSLNISKGKHDLKLQIQRGHASSTPTMPMLTKGQIVWADEKVKFELCPIDDKPSPIYGISYWPVPQLQH